MLGLSNKGNNWKLVIANFIVTFLVQMAFPLNDIINTGILPTTFEVLKAASNSLIITLIFFGYNRKKKE